MAYEDSTLLASARKEQDEYMKEKNANGLSQAKDIVKMARETNAKFGGTFSNGVGSNTYTQTFLILNTSQQFITSTDIYYV